MCNYKIKDFSHIPRSHRIIRRARARVGSRGRPIGITDTHRDTRAAALRDKLDGELVRYQIAYMRFMSERIYEIIIDRILLPGYQPPRGPAIAQRFRLALLF